MTITSIIQTSATALAVLVCLLLILAALSDFRCATIRTGDAGLVLACRASRLEQPR